MLHMSLALHFVCGGVYFTPQGAQNEKTARNPFSFLSSQVTGEDSRMSSQLKCPAVLMADDDADDCLFVKDAFKATRMETNLRFVEDGQELMDYLHRTGKYADTALSPCPDLVLLDLNMPRKDGREALKEIKSDPVLKAIPVVILTTSKEARDVAQSYALGAASFIVKPSGFNDFIELARTLEKYWFGLVELPAKGERC